MESFHQYRDQAVKNLKTADHMVSVTYPLVKDPKLLIAVLDNVFLALTNSMTAILHFDRTFNKIPVFQDSFESKFNRFKESSTITHKLNKEYLQFMLDIRAILENHKQSPIEFSKDDKFVICSKDYKMKALSVPEIKNYILKTKDFVNLMSKIVSQHDGLFK